MISFSSACHPIVSSRDGLSTRNSSRTPRSPARRSAPIGPKRKKESADAPGQPGALHVSLSVPMSADAPDLNALLRQRLGLRRLRAARRARKLDPLLSIRDFNRAEAHQLLTGRTDPNGWGR